jgi:hypothetical protein
MQAITLRHIAVGVLLGVAGTCLAKSGQPELPVASNGDCEELAQANTSERRRVERAMIAVREAAAAECACEQSDPQPAGPPQGLPLVLESAGDGLSIAQRARMILQQQGALIQALELAPEDQERMLNVLSEQEQRRQPGGPDATLDEVTLRQREDAELSRAIGRDKAEQFAQLRAAEPARQELKRVRDRLEEAGAPLTLEQQRAIASLMTGVPIQSPRPVPGEPWDQAVNRFRTWASERDRTFREHAAGILSATQVKTLEDAAELREAQMPRLRAVATAQSAAAGSGG